MSQSLRRSATLDEFWAIPDSERFHELVGGELIQKAAPSGEHGGAQAGLVAAVLPSFQRKPGGSGGPGGWWIATEVEVLLSSNDVVRPDVLGWRRERSPDRPTGTPVKLRPDWICEIVSQTNATDDTVKKLRLYQRAAIPHYWIVDPRDATMTVMRWSEAGYVTLLCAERGEIVRAEPFDAIELPSARFSVTTQPSNSWRPPAFPSTRASFEGPAPAATGPPTNPKSKNSFPAQARGESLTCAPRLLSRASRGKP